MARTIRNLALALTGAGALSLMSAVALAAPQALGLVASAGPVPLTCLGAECAAEFSAFCLQQERRPPEPGERYEIADVGALKLVGERADGSRVVLDAEAELSFTALRTHVAVRLSMSSRRFDSLGLVKAFVEVDRKAVLFPEAGQDDPSPFGESEKMLVATTLRSMGAKLVDGDTARMVAARMTLAMVNRAGTRDLIADDARQAMYDRVVESRGAAAEGEGRALFERAYENCSGNQAYMLSPPSFTGCMRSKHDGFLGTLNSAYWDATRSGS